MRYEMEELVPIVEKLAGAYTSYESSSITYEKAGQLMEAVLYCIHEEELTDCHAVIPSAGVSAQQAYEAGARAVVAKTKKALDLYNAILPDFSDYENRCLRETFVDELPEFFKWYDARFCPQNEILTLDYPVLKDLKDLAGIDKIYEYICCIHMEQQFLHMFPEEYVIQVLSQYDGQYRDGLENICEIVLTSVIVRALLGQRVSGSEPDEEYMQELRDMICRAEPCQLREQMEQIVYAFVQRGGENADSVEPRLSDASLTEYLFGGLDDIVSRLKCASDYNT